VEYFNDQKLFLWRFLVVKIDKNIIFEQVTFKQKGNELSEI